MTTSPRKRRVRFQAATVLHAFTHRRTPEDVDGRRWDVPCIVGLPWTHGTPPRTSRSWFNVRFADGTIDQRHKTELYVVPGTVTYSRLSPYGVRPAVHKAVRDTTMGFWWVNGGGTAERPATTYEIARAMFADAPPHEGWTLLDGISAVARRKALPIGADVTPSAVEEADQKVRAEALSKRREARRDHAYAMVAKHDSKVKRHKRLAAKWRAVLKRAERALEEES